MSGAPGGGAISPPVDPATARPPWSPRGLRLGDALLWLGAALCLLPQVSGGVALLGGCALALALGEGAPTAGKRWAHRLMGLSVAGLGAGADLGAVLRVGGSGVLATAAGICFALALGLLLGRLLRVPRDVSTLVSVGTAICGGSAIAAVAPMLRAKPGEVSLALGVVFLLNAVGLFLFPWLGARLGLSQAEFGLWAALAIHDTSSVVGACLRYGATALAVGTLVKLARALWIIPVTAGVGLMLRRREQRGAAAGAAQGAAPRPYFLLGFVVMAALCTYLPGRAYGVGPQLAALARRLLVVTLFLVGSGLSRATLRAVGLRPLVQGVALWTLVAAASLGAIRLGWLTVAQL